MAPPNKVWLRRRRREGSTDGKDWDDIRAIRFSNTDPPPDWPFGVRPISLEGLGLFGIVPASNKLFWDGREVVLRNRIRLSWWQGFLATVAAFGTWDLPR